MEIWPGKKRGRVAEGVSQLFIRRRRLPGGGLRLEGILRAPNGVEGLLFYEVPREQAAWVTPLADPLVVGFIHAMMRLGAPVRVHGAVTARLLEQLAEFQRIFIRWSPNLFREVEIRPDKIVRPRRPPRTARPLLAFSGGTDSLFSAWNWTQPTRTDGRLEWAVMAQGFDVGMEADVFFARQIAEGQAALATRGVSLFGVRTNCMFALGCYELKWGKFAHGPATAALLLLFQKKFDLGILSSTYICDNLLLPWGSNPLTDPLMSSGEMSILHFGAAYDRLLKLKALAPWREGLASMRVCWTWPREKANCGCCYKCIVVRLLLIVLGMPDATPFDGELTPEMVLNLDLENRYLVNNWARMLAVAEVEIPDSPWLPVIRSAVQHGREVYGGVS